MYNLFLPISPTICQIKSLPLHFSDFKKFHPSFTKQINVCGTNYGLSSKTALPFTKQINVCGTNYGLSSKTALPLFHSHTLFLFIY